MCVFLLLLVNFGTFIFILCLLKFVLILGPLPGDRNEFSVTCPLVAKLTKPELLFSVRKEAATCEATLQVG